EPARRAAEVRADSQESVEIVFGADDPDALALHPLLRDLAHRVLGRIAGLEAGGRLEEHAREEHAQDSSARHREAGEDRAPAGEREEVSAGPDEVPALALGDAWVAAGHGCFSSRWKRQLPDTKGAVGQAARARLRQIVAVAFCAGQR